MSQPPEEERAHGRITMKTYYKYFTTERGHLFTLLMVVTFVLAEVRKHYQYCVHVYGSIVCKHDTIVRALFFSLLPYAQYACRVVIDCISVYKHVYILIKKYLCSFPFTIRCHKCDCQLPDQSRLSTTPAYMKILRLDSMCNAECQKLQCSIAAHAVL